MFVSFLLFSSLAYATVEEIEPDVEIKACLPINQETLSLLPDGETILTNFISLLTQFKNSFTSIRVTAWRGKSNLEQETTWHTFSILENGEKDHVRDSHSWVSLSQGQEVEPMPEIPADFSDQVQDDVVIVRNLIGEQLFNVQWIDVAFYKWLKFPTCPVHIRASLHTREKGELCDRNSRQCHFVCDVEECRRDRSPISIWSQMQ